MRKPRIISLSPLIYFFQRLLSRTTPASPFCDETELGLSGEDGPPFLWVGVDGASVPGGLSLTLLRDPVGAMKDAIGTFPDQIG